METLDVFVPALFGILTVTSIFAVGALIGDYIIPAITKAIKGEPQPKLRVDYAEKDWIQTLTSYRH